MNRAADLTGRACLLLLALAAPAGAQDPLSAAAVFRQLNDTAVAIYQDAKRRFLAEADPVVIASTRGVVIRHRGAVTQAGDIPAAYQLLKTVDHVPRSIWAALRPAIDGMDGDHAWRGKLSDLRTRTAAALEALPRAELARSAMKRSESTLRGSLALIDRYLAQGVPAREQFQADIKPFTPALLADAADAARAQINAIDRVVRPWWDGLSQAERERTYVVVLGGKTSRPGNVAYSYFVNLLGPAEDGHRVVYAESLFDEKAADAILGSLLTDRRLSLDFFADERRMERDLLADGAEARLLQLFGRLGTP